MKNSVAELPFNKFLGLQIAAPPSVLRLPAGEQYLNHVGTVHASAQIALAEASTGEFLLQLWGEASGNIALVRRLQAKFHRPAKGAITSTVVISPEALERFRGEVARKGRAVVGIAVEIHDESGAHTLSASVEWFVSKS